MADENEVTFTIDRGIEIPTIQRDSKYPWSDMTAGDSIFVEGSVGASAAQGARLWVKNHAEGLRVVSRTLDGGTRIWFVNTGDDVEDEAEVEA